MMAELSPQLEATWTYLISKEKLFKRLVEKGIFTKEDTDTFLDIMYDQLDIILNPGAKLTSIGAIMQEPEVKADCAVVSLTDIARAKAEKNPGYLIQSWLRSDNTIELLRAWELKHNKFFDNDACNTLIDEVRKSGATMTPRLWSTRTKAIGIVSVKGKGGGTKAAPDIALAFRAWLEPEIMLEMISRFKHFDTVYKIAENGDVVKRPL